MGLTIKRALLMIILLALVAGYFLILTSGAAQARAAGWLEATGISTVHGRALAHQQEQDRQIGTLASRLMLANERIEGTGERLQQRMARAAVASVGSLPAGAVPYLGWAVVVGVTGYELMLACENLRDLDALYDDFGIDGQIDPQLKSFICDPDLSSFSEAYERIPDALAAQYAEFQSWAQATERALPPIPEPAE